MSARPRSRRPQLAVACQGRSTRDASRDPGVLAVQELGPGRADGSKGTTTDICGQTISLERSLKSVVGDSRYQLVRTTPYVKPGTNHGTQGARILYDTSKFRLVSHAWRRPDRKLQHLVRHEHAAAELQ